MEGGREGAVDQFPVTAGVPEPHARYVQLAVAHVADRDGAFGAAAGLDAAEECGAGHGQSARRRLTGHHDGCRAGRIVADDGQGRRSGTDAGRREPDWHRHRSHGPIDSGLEVTCGTWNSADELVMSVTESRQAARAKIAHSRLSAGGSRSAAGSGSTRAEQAADQVRLGGTPLVLDQQDRVRDAGQVGGDDPADREPVVLVGLVDQARNGSSASEPAATLVV